MKKVLIYILAGLTSIGVWAYICTYTIPFLLWLLHYSLGGFDDIEDFSLGILAFFIIALLLHFVVLLVISLRRKINHKKKSKAINDYVFLLFYIVPIASSFLFCLHTFAKYGGCGQWYGKYYAAYEGVFNKFGHNIYSGTSYHVEGEYVYSSKSKFTGSIYDLERKEYLLKDANLKFDGEIFEENGRYGIRLRLTNIVVLPPVYEYLKFHDTGWIIAKKNGEYTLLDPLGIDEEMEYDDIEPRRDSNGKYVYVECKRDDRTCLYKLQSYSEFQEFGFAKSQILDTKYELYKVLSEDLFVVYDDELGYTVLDKDGNNVLEQWYEHYSNLPEQYRD